MKNRRIVFTKFVVILTILALLFTACGPKKQDPTNPGNTTASSTDPTGTNPSSTNESTNPIQPSTLDNCKAALKEYQSENTNTDGFVVYSDGNFFAVIGGQLYSAQNILPYSYPDAGASILPAVADFRGIPYITDGQTAKACNYSLDATADGKTYHISFYMEGSVQAPQFISLYSKNNVQIAKGVIGQVTFSQPTENPIKNVIFMIADGGGYDNFTLADKVKKETLNRGLDRLAGAKTQLTNNLLSGLGKSQVDGLYLNEFLVGSANTLLLLPHDDDDGGTTYITDSSAAGTALSTGYKTTYCYAGIDSDRNPRASLPELARLNGMSTGLVTTKSYVDATPLAFFTSHSIHRYEYQDNSLQALLSGIDVMIAEGTEFGDLCDGDPSSHPDISAYSMGYTVARSKTELLNKANDASTKKLWAPILGVSDSSKKLKTENRDLAADHISYDVDAATSAEQPSLLDMTKAALQVLGNNINNPEGFFLMIEGGALDNAAESGYIRPTIGEYLAFDEAFGYCVNWASQRNDTIVIAVPDHDSGGFYGIEVCEDELIDGLITGKIGDTQFHSLLHYEDIKKALNEIGADTDGMGIHGGHTDMAVPICLYAPEGIKETLLKNMTLPTATGNVRTGNSEYYVKNEGDSPTWYSSSAVNPDYLIDNTKIAPAIAKTLGLGSLDLATNMLYQPVGSLNEDEEFTGTYGGSIVYDEDTYYSTRYDMSCKITYSSKDKALQADKNSLVYTYNGTQHNNIKIANQPLKSLYIQQEQEIPEYGTFFVPYDTFLKANFGWSVTISCDGYGFDPVLIGRGNADIILPDTIDGKQIIYTDGVKFYKPGDTISYTGSNVVLDAYIK